MKRLLVLFVLLFTVLFSHIVVAQNWQMQNSNFPADVMVMDFSAPNDQVCWAIASTINGTPYGGYSRTTDAGNNWVCDTIGNNWDGYLYQIYSMDANTAYIVSQSGSTKGIYKTTDGGSTWNRQNAYNTSLYGPGYIHFFDSQNGVVIGDPDFETYTTTNGGQIWNPVTMPPPISGEWGCWNSGNGITAVGDNVWFSTGARVFKSTDKGYTWSVILTEPQYSSYWPCIKFQDSQTGIYALKLQGALNHIYRKTTDGGTTWDTLSNSILDNLAPTVMQHIPGTAATYILAGGMPQGMRGVAVTYDAGESWNLIDTDGCNFVEFPSDAVGWGSQYSTNAVQKYIGPPFPVELTSFFAEAQNQKVILKWSTATETNNQGFEILRFVQNDRQGWEKIGFVPGFGTTTEPKTYSYTDSKVSAGRYTYRLKQIDFDGSFEYSPEVEVEVSAPLEYSLEQNYPNPFNPTTTIGFGIENKSNVKITILNSIGEEVAVVLNEEREAGFHRVEFNATNLPSGVYFYQLRAGEFFSTKKMILLK